MKLEQSKLTIRKYNEIPDWDAFVEAHPHGTILHTTDMIRCEECTKRHIPHAFGVLDSNENLCALLVAVRVSMLTGVPSTLTSRSIFYAEPICLDTPEGHAGYNVLLRHHDQCMCKTTLFAEMRLVHEVSGFHSQLIENGYQRRGYLNYELNLAGSEVELFSAIGQKSRNNVRCANRKGVRVDEVDPADCVELIYSLISESYAHSKVPMVDSTLFQSAASILSRSQFRVMTAIYNETPIALVCFLTFKKRVICWYAGTKRLPGVPAVSRVFWEAIRQFAREGFEIFDFAGGGWEGEEYGPGRFKSKFGGQQSNYGRYRKIYAPWKLKTAQSVYETVREYIAPKSQLDTILRQ